MAHASLAISSLGMAMNIALTVLCAGCIGHDVEHCTELSAACIGVGAVSFTYVSCKLPRHALICSLAMPQVCTVNLVCLIPLHCHVMHYILPQNSVAFQTLLLHLPTPEQHNLGT